MYEGNIFKDLSTKRQHIIGPMKNECNNRKTCLELHSVRTYLSVLVKRY